MRDNEVIRFAGDVAIDSIQIISSNGFGVEVKNQVIALEIYEDLFSPFTTGLLAFRDSLDLVNLFPFIGEESVTFRIRTPSFNDKDMIFDQQFYIYKISERSMVGDRSVVYEARFFSREALVDINKKISRSFQGKISDIATTLIKDQHDGLETNKNAVVEETPNGFKFISNYWSPVKCLNYAAETASNQNGSANYLFFENRSGFNFVSAEYLYSLPIKQEFTYDAFLRDIRPDGSSVKNVEKEYQRIIKINIPNIFDYVDRSRMGMFASKLISHDILTKKYVSKNFDMLDEFNKQVHLNNYAVTSSNNIRRPNSLILDYHKYYGNFNNFGDVTNARTIQKRMSSLQQMSATKLQIVVPGRTDYTVGNKVVVNLNKFNPIELSDEQNDILDNIFSGNYIISSVSHYIDRENHECRMELIKDSFIVDLDKGGR
jgi:hypothetical protein